MSSAKFYIVSITTISANTAKSIYKLQDYIKYED